MPDEPSGITLRTATEDTFRTIVTPLGTAFGEPWDDNEIDLQLKTAEFDRVIGAFEGDTAVGASGAYTFRMTTPGGEVGAAGITLVGVLPSHRRRGILRMMMTDLFETAAVRGEPVAVLWASEAAIYQKFGYGIAAFQTTFDAVKDKIRFRTPSGLDGQARIRMVEPDDAVALFSPIFEARRSAVPGSLTRPHAFWRYGLLFDATWLHGANGAKHLAVLEVDGEPRAYVVYRLKADWQPSGPANVLTVMELIGLDAAAEQALWEWVFSIDLVGVVKCWRGPAPHPLTLAITEPRRLNAIVSDGTWLRILDVAAALGARSYQGPGSLVLELTDDFMPANAGRWQLTVPGPGSPGEVARAPESAPSDLALDISALAATYLGTVRFGDLARVGRVVECRPGAAAAADALWATTISPFNSTMF